MRIIFSTLKFKLYILLFIKKKINIFQKILKPNQTFPLITLQILSNQGHPDHTCVYRFRVHGDIVKVK